MGMFTNTQKITRIVFEPKTPCHNICPLGQLYCNELAQGGCVGMSADYDNNFTITFEPNELVCDYIDVEKWIKSELSNKNLIIEDCVTKLFDYINSTYKPKYLKVESFVDNAVHGPVTVSRESE